MPGYSLLGERFVKTAPADSNRNHAERLWVQPEDRLRSSPATRRSPLLRGRPPIPSVSIWGSNPRSQASKHAHAAPVIAFLSICKLDPAHRCPEEVVVVA